jgi:hypothetical protein
MRKNESKEIGGKRNGKRARKTYKKNKKRAKSRYFRFIPLVNFPVE